jgi:hypothetical protein
MSLALRERDYRVRVLRSVRNISNDIEGEIVYREGDYCAILKQQIKSPLGTDPNDHCVGYIAHPFGNL